MILGLVCGLSLAASCDKKPDLFYPETKDFCGQWICTITDANDAEDVWGEEVSVYTFNTADNNADIWITDNKSEGGIIASYTEGNVKATTDIKGTTFASANEATEQVSAIKNGGVFKNAVKVKPQYLEGNPIEVDSIDFVLDFYFKGQEYKLRYSGHRQTGWEDYVQ